MNKPIVFYFKDTMFVISPSSLVILVVIGLGLILGVALLVSHLLAKD